MEFENKKLAEEVTVLKAQAVSQDMYSNQFQPTANMPINRLSPGNCIDNVTKVDNTAITVISENISLAIGSSVDNSCSSTNTTSRS